MNTENSQANANAEKSPPEIAKWTTGVVAVASGAASIYGFFKSWNSSVFAFLGMVLGIGVLLIVARAAKDAAKAKSSFYSNLAKGFTAFAVLYFVAFMCLVFLPLVKWASQTSSSKTEPAITNSQAVGPHITDATPHQTTDSGTNKDIVAPPPKPRLFNHVKVTFTVFGDTATSNATIKWGHPDKEGQQYIKMWTLWAGKTDTKEFDVRDDETEFETQTEGTANTGYILLVEVDGKEAIECKYNARPDGWSGCTNKGIVKTYRSARLNETGEGRINVFFKGIPNPGVIPDREG